VLWGVLFSLAPFAQVFRTNVSGTLHGAGRTTLGTFGRRLRSSLVVAQIAISSVLLVSAGLLAKGFYELQRVDAGFDDRGVLTFKLSLAGSRHRGPAAATFSRQLRERLAALPGVTAAGAISHLPYDTVPNWGTPYLPEHVSDLNLAGVADARAVSPGYFEATGAQLVDGRWFNDGDIVGAQPVAIVDTLLAARMWPGRSGIGERLKADPWTTGKPGVTVTIVGIVRHVRHREITRDLREQMYFPAAQSSRNPMAYVLKAQSAPTDLTAAVRRVMAELDPTLPIYDVRPLATYTRDARAVRTFTLVLALAFAASAILLAAVGLYGVISYTAAGRRREFGVRLALGARGGQVASLVLRDAAVLAGIGTAMGCLGAAAAAPLLRTQLYSVSPFHPAAYAAGAVLILLAAIVAACRPAQRAASASPLESLRME
jgi:predicted permease